MAEQPLSIQFEDIPLEQAPHAPRVLSWSMRIQSLR
jgi:hypothetical protein